MHKEKPLSHKPVHIHQAVTAADILTTRDLFEEYAESLEYSLCFQNFSAELAALPGDYAPPSGSLLLASLNDETAGCIALRRLEEGICEMKRLYVRPSFRGHGIGRKLVETLVSEARQKGYKAMRLDTLPIQDRAQGLYELIGFVDIPPYRHNPIEGARYMELLL